MAAAGGDAERGNESALAVFKNEFGPFISAIRRMPALNFPSPSAINRSTRSSGSVYRTTIGK